MRCQRDQEGCRVHMEKVSRGRQCAPYQSEETRGEETAGCMDMSES